MKNLLLSVSKDTKFNFKRFSRDQIIILIKPLFISSVTTKGQLYQLSKVIRIECLEVLLHLTGKFPLNHTVKLNMIKNHF